MAKTGTKRAKKGVIPKTWTTAKVRRNAKGQVQVLIGRKANPVKPRRRVARKTVRKTVRKAMRRRR